MMSILYNI